MINQELMVSTVIGMLNDLIKERDAALAKLNEARNRVHELEAKLEAATNVIIDLTPYSTTEDTVTEEQAAEYNQMLADQELEENLLAALPDTTDFDSEW